MRYFTSYIPHQSYLGISTKFLVLAQKKIRIFCTGKVLTANKK
jgi:hypothetical protein